MAVLERHPQELGDRLERQLGRDIDDEVTPAVGGRHGSIDDALAHQAQVVLERTDDLGREPPVQELAEPGVVGRVHLQHEPAGVADLGAACRLLGRQLLQLHHPAEGVLRGERVPVAVERADVAVRRERPEARAVRLGVVVDRRLGAEALEPFVRDTIGEHVATQQVDVRQARS